MILTCPNCATRYEADAAKFLPAGRKVRCAKCGHTWHQPAPETEEGAPVAVEEAVAGEPERQPETEAAAPFAPLSAAKASQAALVSPAWRAGALTGWAALIAVVALLIWAGIALRKDIATAWPQTATLYSWMGLDVNTVGLAFQDVSYRVISLDDQPILQLKGKVVNITARALEVPPIRASLTDEQRRELYDWTFNAEVKKLAPGKTASFNARLPSPPTSARHVDLKFVEG